MTGLSVHSKLQIQTTAGIPTRYRSADRAPRRARGSQESRLLRPMLGSSDEDFEGGTQAPLWDESDEDTTDVQL